MPDENPAAPTAQQPAGAPAPAPAVTTPPPVAATPIAGATPPAAATPAPAVSVGLLTTDPPAPGAPEPSWLRSRLDQAKRTERAAILAELGVTDPAAAKAALDAAKAAEEAQKSEIQKARERVAALESTAARATLLEQTIKARADAELASLTDQQRAAVAAVAGTDSARVLSTIDALKPTWAAAAPAAVVTPPPAAAPVVTPPAAAPPPANTSPAPNAPASASPGSPPDRKAEYQALKLKNPVQAAAYLNRYSNEIYPRA